MPNQPLLGINHTPELKVVCSVVAPIPPPWIEDKCSNNHQLIHVTAWCQRFIANVRASIQQRPLHRPAHLTVESAEQFLMKRSQSQFFSKELNQLMNIVFRHPVLLLHSILTLISLVSFVWVGGYLIPISLNHLVILPFCLVRVCCTNYSLSTNMSLSAIAALVYLMCYR